jgi:hypothetical protein
MDYEMLLLVHLSVLLSYPWNLNLSKWIDKTITVFFAFGGETSFGRGVIIDFTSNSMEQLCTFSIAKTYI